MEPSINEQCAVILVRHVVLGIQKRKFETTEKMSAVYDWVGSLSSQPESFSLSGCGLPDLLPSLSVMAADRSILNMSETDELNFVGFGDILGTDHTDTFQYWLYNIRDINDTLPDIVMQGDLYRQVFLLPFSHSFPICWDQYMVILFERDNIGIINFVTLYRSYTIWKSSSLAMLWFNFILGLNFIFFCFCV